MFLEAPVDTGFSYSTRNASEEPQYNNLQTAQDILGALKVFMERYPEYKNRSLYLMGEGYASYFVLGTAIQIVEAQGGGQMKEVKLEGLAIGNGDLSLTQQLNSAPQVLYYRGMFGKRFGYLTFGDLGIVTFGDLGIVTLEIWVSLLLTVWVGIVTFTMRVSLLLTVWVSLLPTGIYQNQCNLAQYVRFNASGIPNAYPHPLTDLLKECGKLVVEMGYEQIWNSR
ncbi:unnamed protein product [Anisakis simplex]|uniref:Uncharacterized protein n=1 Tax=Anisakis simplex TaxID=6269 RepID=A0A3P6SN99_ANISI|nr:unnamed protein product [Anisakis simplex]